ncbi:amino acid ABC transporter permease [Aminivibrio sp.]|jgi:polar amino acid transport system permease protein|uniref:amino acid ABC transporter permease n=1 Tax=Aminivibrio sp. TaxID=1872489 RepID=UPI001A5F3748|nr:amino acid ABC transporter permease [Aminivibrio sp.]MBL3538445.1 amino acid ABC transporter permease [Aminivibrio sp.]MDK2958365.1 arginine/lysine/histidine transport system permease protein [Synergistaceae bacterium]
MTLDFSAIVPYLHMLLTGAKVTIQASALSVLFGAILGIFVGALRVVPFAPVRAAAATYIYIIRGTPLLIQLFLIYFGLPSLGLNLPAFTAGIIGLSINSSGYVGEIVRGGIEAVPKGQWEASKVLGLSYLKTMRFIILPQAIRNMLPAIGNEFVTLIKESSLLSTLAITELTMVGQQVRSVTYASFETFIAVGIIYLVMTSVTSFSLQCVEKKWKVS